jgi:hypothetical protein
MITNFTKRSRDDSFFDRLEAAVGRSARHIVDLLQQHLSLCLHLQINGDSAIKPWYRYNMFLYAHQRAWQRILESFRRTQLKPLYPIVDVAPVSWRMRNLVFRHLPQPVVQRIARFKHAMVRAGVLPS